MSGFMRTGERLVAAQSSRSIAVCRYPLLRGRCGACGGGGSGRRCRTTWGPDPALFGGLALCEVSGEVVGVGVLDLGCREEDGLATLFQIQLIIRLVSLAIHAYVSPAVPCNAGNAPLVLP